MILTSVPIYFVWYHCASILVLLKQDPAISKDAGDFVWRLAPSLIPYLLFEVMKKYLIAQRIMKPMIIVLLITNLIHVAFCYLYIYALYLGFLGAPSATATAQIFMLLIRVGLIYWKKYHHKTWPSINMEIFKGWGTILKFGVPGAMMLCLEWWSFEICALAAGWLGAIQLDSFVVLLQIQSFIFMMSGHTLTLAVDTFPMC